MEKLELFTLDSAGRGKLKRYLQERLEKPLSQLASFLIIEDTDSHELMNFKFHVIRAFYEQYLFKFHDMVLEQIDLGGSSVAIQVNISNYLRSLIELITKDIIDGYRQKSGLGMLNTQVELRQQYLDKIVKLLDAADVKMPAVEA